MARIMALGAATGLSGALAYATEDQFDKLVGQPVDIAPSAYQYRADRKPADNPPESWLALMHYAGLPLNKPVDVKSPPIQRVLCSLLWEEIRPVHQLELTWTPNSRRRTAPEDLEITTLSAQGGSSSWWNNLGAAKQTRRPAVSPDGNTVTFDVNEDTCGIVVSAPGFSRDAGDEVPTVRALVADTWKKMDIEVEWAFDSGAKAGDYGGRMEAYDGRLAALQPLDNDLSTSVTTPTSWRSAGKGHGRRGIKATLLYMGISKWRHQQPFTSQRDDVARTIVTLWTKAGNFSFLAADLEHGPILAPEYGFFIRRTSNLSPADADVPQQHAAPAPLANKMDSIAGSHDLLGWGSDDTPWFGGNPTKNPVVVQGITFPARCLAMHPGPHDDVAVSWRSPASGPVRVNASLSHGQSCGNGIEWWLIREHGADWHTLSHGATTGTGSRTIPENVEERSTLDSVSIESGDSVSLVIGPNGGHQCDTTIVNLVVVELGGAGRTWDLTHDVVSSIHAANPHPDGLGNAEVWRFYARKSTTPIIPSEPPIVQASQAASATEFIKELKERNLNTIRRQIRTHEEQTWEGAVSAMFGSNPPPHPAPPASYEPPMKVIVPSDRLTAQWNLGVWHLTRHAGTNPKTGRRWFNDYPYGILGAETYLILRVLDLMGSHEAAADGFDQWLSLPLDHSATGHNEGSLPDRPNGLFSDGHGCLTLAEGPDGYGGQMDGIHAFGPGSIGWALTEHYWMTGDKEWLRASAPRLIANADWMLRQRRVMTGAVPGGERLWCRGLQPALQVTPDSGGLWMQFYECEAYYWASVSRLAATIAEFDPKEGARLASEAESYRKDLLAAVERSIALSPLVPVRDGTYHSVIPAACYVRGLCTGAWGWERDGSGEHVGPLYWDTVQSAAALVSPAGLLPANDVRVQGYLDVLEDRLLLENAYVAQRTKGDWFMAGWQYQAGLERTTNMHLAGDDVPVFLRSLFNGYAVDILPDDGYVFNEHAVHGPPDKVFEEAAFLERFRNLLVMEDGKRLWLARATPRAWLKQGEKIDVENAPTHFGTVSYQIVSDVAHHKITATVTMPSRGSEAEVWLRLRHPGDARIVSVTVNEKQWHDFDAGTEVIKLHGIRGTVDVVARY